MGKIVVILVFCLCLSLIACSRQVPTSIPETATAVSPPTTLPTATLPLTPTATFAFSACADFERIKVGEYVLHNNVWNKGSRTDYTQCVLAQSDTPPTTLGWRWDWPGNAREIQAYPEVMVGDSPWDREPPTGGLPLPVTARDVLVTYTASIQATGQWNVAFDLWLTSDPAPAEQNITDEVMIWVDAQGLVSGPPLYDQVTLGGVEYQVYVSPGHGDASGGSAATWQYIAFVTKKPLLAATLNMSHFLDYLVEKQVIEPDRYIASIELGTEIESGQGEFILSAYQVTIPVTASGISAASSTPTPAAGRITHISGLPDTYYEATYNRLTYGLYVPPNYDPAQSYPLIMYLHGYGYTASDYLVWYRRDIQARTPCFVFTPKTPPAWGDWSGWWDTLSEPIQVTLEVLDQLMAEYSIDKCRLYVYGISMGGEGVFDLLDKHPDKFAAGMSVCGGGRPQWAANVAQTPLWMFHGGKDTVNPPALTEDVYRALVALGATRMRYTNYPDRGHEIWNLAAKEPAWTEWMFAQSRCDAVCPAPTGKLALELGRLDDGTLRLTWNDIRNPAAKADQIWYYKILNGEELIGTTEFIKTTFDYRPEKAGGVFSVQAINYCFGASERSNTVTVDN